MKKLSECAAGDRVQVVRLDGEGVFKRRLLEMGFVSGAGVEIIKYAPLKDPVELIVGQSRISLRVDEACGVIVRDVELSVEEQ